ncbi:MAG TPA: carboxypeptidase regulatory-like domain-containing protein [Terriglobales bacterium]|nr:carboxypeptidase regulatory-like domain-containing protein [Terriglobales bacterium]
MQLSKLRTISMLGSLAFGMALLTAAPSLAAQDTAQIQGVVTDASGAAVPGVAITATNAQTGAVRSVEAGADGRFLLPALPLGTYNLKYVKTGFASTEITGIVLEIGTVADRHDTLKLAASQTTVEVSGVAPPIDTTKSNVAGVITSTQIDQLPIANRQYLNLSLLMPGSTQDASRSFYSNVQLGGGDHYYSNGFTVDGVNNTWAEMGEPRENFPEGAVAEFKVYSSQFKADEGGMASGGAISVVTKSGTNQYHGDAFEYWRNQALNRDNSFQQAAELQQHTGKAPLDRNQFGGSLGGPVMKNKLHLFGAWESTLTQGSYTVFTNNPAIFGTFQGVYKQPSHDDLLTVRGDYQINGRQSMFVRWGDEWNLLTCQGCGGASSANAGYDGLLPRHSLVVGHTWALSSNIVNDFRFQYAKASYLLAPSGCPNACGQGIWTAIGQYPASRFVPYNTTLSFPDFSFGSDYGDDGIETHWEASDNFSIFKGSHNIKWGFDTSYIPFADDAPVGIKGGFSFSSDPTQPLLANGAPGNASFSAANLYYPASGTTPAYGPTSFSQTIPPVLTSVPTAQTSYFVMDDWNGIRNLTLSAGLRYDREYGSFDEGLNPANFAKPVPFLGNPSKRGDKNNFGPRLGATWNVRGTGHDVVRAGYGIYYNNLQTLQNFSEDRNFTQSVVSLTCSKPGQASCPSYPSAFANGQTAASVLPTVTVLAPNYQNPYSQQFNLGYSREITPNFSIHADGVYELTLRDYRTVDLNYAVSNPRPLPQFARILQHDPISKSKYKALYVRADRRFSNKYQFLVSYSLTSCYDDNPQGTVTNYANFGQDWGPCSIDRRHALVASGSYQAPWGITLGTIFNVRSSTPFSETSTTRNLDGSSQYVIGTSRNQGRRDLDFAAINAYRTSLTFKDSQGVIHNFPAVDASMLANGRVDTVDFRAARSFSLGEGKRVDVIGQVFNLLGTYNYTGITTNLSSLTWGQPTGAGPLQQAELAVHFVF